MDLGDVPGGDGGVVGVGGFRAGALDLDSTDGGGGGGVIVVDETVGRDGDHVGVGVRVLVDPCLLDSVPCGGLVGCDPVVLVLDAAEDVGVGGNTLADAKHVVPHVGRRLEAIAPHHCVEGRARDKPKALLVPGTAPLRQRREILPPRLAIGRGGESVGRQEVGNVFTDLGGGGEGGTCSYFVGGWGCGQRPVEYPDHVGGGGGNPGKERGGSTSSLQLCGWMVGVMVMMEMAMVMEIDGDDGD